MKRFSLVSLTLAIGLVWLSVVARTAPGGYHLIKKIPFGAAEGGGEYFDYITVDNAARRLYLSHGTEVKVVDADSYHLLGNITGLKRDHGVALVPEAGRGFITDGEAQKIVMFDLRTLRTLAEIQGEKDADFIMYDPASKHVFAFNGDANNATVIDPVKGSVIATVPLGGAPEQAVADGKGMIYDNLQNKDEVVALDSRTLQIQSRWPVAPAGHPVAIAMDRQHRRLFISGRDPKMLVMMNADNGQIIGQPFPIGDRVDTNIFDAERSIVGSATRDGFIYLFHEDSGDKLTAIEPVKTEFGAKTMGLDPKTHYLLVDTSDFDPPAAPTPQQPNPQPRPRPGTFRLLVYGR